MRAFVALEVSDLEALDRIVALQAELPGADSVKLVQMENLHFTVKFLGEISEADGAEAKSRLRTVRARACDVDISGVGAFPSMGRPSVIWVGVAHENEEAVGAIAAEVSVALEGLGERDERPFTPHLTVARVRSGRSVPELPAFLRRNSGRAFGRTKLASLKLKSSRLTPSGPVYSDIGEYQLG